MSEAKNLYIYSISVLCLCYISNSAIIFVLSKHGLSESSEWIGSSLISLVGFPSYLSLSFILFGIFCLVTYLLRNKRGNLIIILSIILLLLHTVHMLSVTL